MTLRTALAAESEGARTDESTTSATDDAPTNSPFSMEYDLSRYTVEDETLDRALSLAVTVSNLL